MRFLIPIFLVLYSCGSDTSDGTKDQSPVEGDSANRIVENNDELDKNLEGKLALSVAGKTLYVDKDGWDSATDLSTYSALTNKDYMCNKSEVKETLQSSGMSERVRNQIRAFDDSFELEYEIQIYVYTKKPLVELYVLPETTPPEADLVRLLRYIGKAYMADGSSKDVDLVIVADSENEEDQRSIEDVIGDKSELSVLSRYSDNVCDYLQ